MVLTQFTKPHVIFSVSSITLTNFVFFAADLVGYALAAKQVYKLTVATVIGEDPKLFHFSSYREQFY